MDRTNFTRDPRKRTQVEGTLSFIEKGALWRLPSANGRCTHARFPLAGNYIINRDITRRSRWYYDTMVAVVKRVGQEIGPEPDQRVTFGEKALSVEKERRVKKRNGGTRERGSAHQIDRANLFLPILDPTPG